MREKEREGVGESLYPLSQEQRSQNTVTAENPSPLNDPKYGGSPPQHSPLALHGTLCNHSTPRLLILSASLSEEP